jgi:hypothetical protein
MDLYGPRAISSINALSKPEMALRPFQRITAQVLDVTGTTALLAIEGRPIVAQLTSVDQATALLTQQTAQFIVTELTSQKITLKMIKGDASETMLAASSSTGTELAMRLLEQNNIPATVNNLMMARSILKQQLPVTRALLNEVMEALSEYDAWGSKEADVAVSLKAAGLPVSAQSIKLASRQPAKISDSISQLIEWLNDMASPDLPAEVLKQLELNMWLLNGLVLDGGDEASKVAEQLKNVLETLGRSLEDILLEKSQSHESTSSEINLLSLARLQKILEEAGKNEAVESIGKFLEDIRSSQFLNTKSEWAEFDFPIQNAKTNTDFSTARLRIARDAKSNYQKIDPTAARLILQVDINSGETVEVDLTVIGTQIRTSVKAPNPLWGEQAESELPSLAQALQSLGFTVQDAQVCLGERESVAESDVAPDSGYLMTVDIEA